VETRLLEARPEQLNLVNLTLCLTGPMRERSLCILLLVFQARPTAARRRCEYRVRSRAQRAPCVPRPDLPARGPACRRRGHR
jgi:hypothetical protein